jgi:hypothetical protein
MEHFRQLRRTGRADRAIDARTIRTTDGNMNPGRFPRNTRAPLNQALRKYGSDAGYRQHLQVQLAWRMAGEIYRSKQAPKTKMGS